MNPYQIVGIIAASMLVFASIVATLTWLGLPLLVAFLGVYVVTMWFMIGMQKRAQQSCQFREQRRMRGVVDAYGDSPDSYDYPTVLSARRPASKQVTGNGLA